MSSPSGSSSWTTIEEYSGEEVEITPPPSSSALRALRNAKKQNGLNDLLSTNGFADSHMKPSKNGHSENPSKASYRALEEHLRAQWMHHEPTIRKETLDSQSVSMSNKSGAPNFRIRRVVMPTANRPPPPSTLSPRVVVMDEQPDPLPASPKNITKILPVDQETKQSTPEKTQVSLTPPTLPTLKVRTTEVESAPVPKIQKKELKSPPSLKDLLNPVQTMNTLPKKSKPSKPVSPPVKNTRGALFDASTRKSPKASELARMIQQKSTFAKQPTDASVSAPFGMDNLTKSKPPMPAPAPPPISLLPNLNVVAKEVPKAPKAAVEKSPSPVRMVTTGPKSQQHNNSRIHQGDSDSESEVDERHHKRRHNKSPKKKYAKHHHDFNDDNNHKIKRGRSPLIDTDGSPIVGRVRRYDAQEMMALRKQRALFELQTMELDGVPLSRPFSLDDSLDDILYELHRARQDRDAAQGLRNYEANILSVVSAVATVADTFEIPIFKTIVGEVREELQQQRTVLRKIYNKRRRKSGPSNPEWDLVFGLGRRIGTTIFENLMSWLDKWKKNRRRKKLEAEQHVQSQYAPQVFHPNWYANGMLQGDPTYNYPNRSTPVIVPHSLPTQQHTTPPTNQNNPPKKSEPNESTTQPIQRIRPKGRMRGPPKNTAKMPDLSQMGPLIQQLGSVVDPGRDGKSASGPIGKPITRFMNPPLKTTTTPPPTATTSSTPTSEKSSTAINEPLTKRTPVRVRSSVATPKPETQSGAATPKVSTNVKAPLVI